MRSSGLALASLLVVACGEPEPAPAAPPAASSTGHVEATAVDEPADEPAAPEEAELDCPARLEQALASVQAHVEARRACTFDNECVAAVRSNACGTPCPTSIRADGLARFRDLVREADPACEAAAAAGCDGVHRRCELARPRCEDGRCAMWGAAIPLREAEVPPENRAGQDPPPPRPPPGEPEEERGRRLFDAIRADDPDLARDFFFPREAFAVVKAIADPDGYWHRLMARYEQDIHALHEELGDLSEAEFVALDIIRRGGWVPVGDEGNALPYWVSRHSRLRYRVGEEERSFEVRVLITWGDRWYVTHLSDFH